jgi:hypothetical protein
MTRRFTQAAAALAVALGLALCPTALAGERSHEYVTDSLSFGANQTEASRNGFDLNNNGVSDNVVGAFLVTLSFVYDFNAPIAASLEEGDVVMLHALRARSFERDPAATWRILYGVPTPDPVSSTRLAGAIRDGQFAGGPGGIPLKLSLVSGQAPIQLDLIGAQLEAICDPTACSGKLGGGISLNQVDAVLIPAIAGALQTVIDASCPTACSPGATTILNLFDANNDQTVTADELRASFLIQVLLLSPDLDLLKANGRPGHDGIRESISVGLGFTAKAAEF